MQRFGDSSLATRKMDVGKGDCLRWFASAWVGSILMLTAGLQAGTYQVGIAPPTVKVMIQGASEGWPFEGTITNRYDLCLARGEHEAMQVVVIATDTLTNVSVTLSQPLRAQGGGALNGEANAWLVGHVDVYDWTGYSDYYPGRADYHGWYPDPLLTFTNSCNINSGDRVAFWIDVSALCEASAGDYVATITITAEDSPITNVQLNIHVWDFALPLKASLPTMFSLNEWLTGNPGGPRPVYGEADWINQGIAQQFYDLMLERRMGGMHLYKMADWTDVEAFDNIVDWTARGCSDVNLKNLGSPNPAQLDRVTDPALSNLVSQLSGAGLLGKAYVYGYDEAGSGLFGALSNMFNKVHTSYPGLRTMTTAKDPDFGMTRPGLRSAVDIWVPQTDDYNQTAANQLRAEGKDMWWYIYSSPWRPYINFYVEYPAIEPRLLMGAMAYKYQTGGFLYYNVTKWPQWDDEWSPLLEENNYLNVPITSGPYTDWFPKSGGAGTGNNGDGSLFCAGADGPLPTIRTENIRDGLEDYEYLKLLADLVETLQARGSLTPEEVAWVNSSQQLLAVPSNIVGSLINYTRVPGQLEDYRQQLAANILTGKVLTAPPRPQLTIAPASTGNVRLLWPTNAPGFNLEACTNLSTSIWSDLLPAPVVIGTNNVVTNAMTETGRFYRLRK